MAAIEQDRDGDRRADRTKRLILLRFHFWRSGPAGAARVAECTSRVGRNPGNERRGEAVVAVAESPAAAVDGRGCVGMPDRNSGADGRFYLRARKFPRARD